MLAVLGANSLCPIRSAAQRQSKYPRPEPGELPYWFRRRRLGDLLTGGNQLEGQSNRCWPIDCMYLIAAGKPLLCSNKKAFTISSTASSEVIPPSLNPRR